MVTTLLSLKTTGIETIEVNVSARRSGTYMTGESGGESKRTSSE
jgi:hypothetical protein